MWCNFILLNNIISKTIRFYIKRLFIILPLEQFDFDSFLLLLLEDFLLWFFLDFEFLHEGILAQELGACNKLLFEFVLVCLPK